MRNEQLQALAERAQVQLELDAGKHADHIKILYHPVQYSIKLKIKRFYGTSRYDHAAQFISNLP